MNETPEQETTKSPEAIKGWLDAAMVKAQQPATEQARGEPRRSFGSDFARRDAPRINEMRRLIDEGKASSPTASKIVITKDNYALIEGWGTREGKIHRHVERYKKAYGR